MTRASDDAFDPDEPTRPVLGRRELGLAGIAAIAGATLGGCELAGPPERIVPPVARAPGSVPGVPVDVATATDRQGYAVGLVVRTREGRPIKIEGNPRHPFSLGGTGPAEQAALADLYDRDRLLALRGPAGAGRHGLLEALRRPRTREGEGLHVLLPPTSSPIVLASLARLREVLPRARVHLDGAEAPVARWAGARIAFGELLEAHRDYAAADVLVSVGSDALSLGPTALRAARFFAGRRAVDRTTPADHRMYAIESALSITGAFADRRFAARPSEVAGFPAELLAELARRGLQVPDVLRAAVAELPDPSPPRRAFVAHVVDAILRARGRVLLEVGDSLPPASHAIAHAIEALVGGGVVRHSASPMAAYGETTFDLAPLIDALDSGAVDTLVVCGGSNPCYGSARADAFDGVVRRAAVRIVLASHPHETAEAATWRVPEAHFLERWGALRAQDGTLGFVQPTSEPLGEVFTTDDLLGELAGAGHAVTARSRVEELASRSDLDAGAFREALATGVVAGSAYAPIEATIAFDAVARAARSLLERASEPRGDDVLELLLAPDPRGATRSPNNGWLRELPEPLTKLVWDNAALIAPATADRLGVATGDVVQIANGGAAVELPAFVQTGQAEDTLVAWRGFGRRAGGRFATRGGADVGPLDALGAWLPPPVRVTPTGRVHVLVTTQSTSRQEGEPVALRVTPAELSADPDRIARRNEDPPSLYFVPTASAHRWAMAIDLAKCTGCSACVVACEVENNTPVVGKMQVSLRREMQWLRVDRYFDQTDGELKVSMQPMLCQHCGKAPCEYVCPTAATVHSEDGLNEMIYNRCVGTRFCSNNCPYKVRRFNYFDFHRDVAPIETLRMNPEVTVRSRGVMEKCTFCVQRLRHGERDAAAAGRALGGDEVETACQQACPTRAIAFGLVSDPTSEVARWHASPRAYAVLGELGVRPRVRYLARIDADEHLRDEEGERR